ncbi:hypothetical protein L6452_17583 [Arctium lappa]|uniref:Uncharacterized protein n=1 Tax=Arctium lappa TaxID=4217 RepID=A0ACB9C3W7_ARCLA|nr:hypothetical protein L6452_17583 [Arctium lappa]
MDRIEEEFRTLKKGSLVVREYTCQFMEKLGLVGHVAPTKKEKIKAYLKGLPADMMSMVCNSKASNLRETIEEAQIMEDVYARGKEEKDVVMGDKRRRGGAQDVETSTTTTVNPTLPLVPGVGSPIILPEIDQLRESSTLNARCRDIFGRIVRNGRQGVPRRRRRTL